MGKHVDRLLTSTLRLDPVTFGVPTNAGVAELVDATDLKDDMPQIDPQPNGRISNQLQGKMIPATDLRGRCFKSA